MAQRWILLVVVLGACAGDPVAGPGTDGGGCGEGSCACTPRSCEEQGVGCGQVGDGCGRLLDCGGCSEPASCGGGGVPGRCGCRAAGSEVCATSPPGCGLVPDGCGGFVACGPCAAGEHCGGAGPNRCGLAPCVPQTCAEHPAAECGQVSDGCGGVITCGSGCTPEQACTGANRCACAPETDAVFCARLSRDCGPAAGNDRCGRPRAVSSCGACALPETCEGGGVPGTCGCAPLTQADCGASGGSAARCGSMADGCGGFVDCGACAQGTCGGGGPGRCGDAPCRALTCADYPQVECGQVTDGCGALISCGAGCAATRTCQRNVCVCTPETDAAFCARLGKTCGSVSATDNCGAPRSVVSCGSCAFPETCGDNGTGPANVCGCARCMGCSPATAQCRPGEVTLGAACGNCGAATSSCTSGCLWSAERCQVNGSCAPPADVGAQLRRSCYCVNCTLDDVDAAHEVKCAYLRWAFFAWGAAMDRTFFSAKVRPVAQAARARGMVAEFGIPEYLPSLSPAAPCPSDGRLHLEVDAARVAAWNAILTAHRPAATIAPFAPVGTDLSFDLQAIWVPGLKPNWVYGVCAGVPSLGSDEGWRYHLYVALAALDAGVGGLYLSQLDLRQAPLGHVQALIAAVRAYSSQLSPGVHLVMGSESADVVADGLPGALDYVKHVVDLDVSLPGAPGGQAWPSILDSDGADAVSCYGANLLEEPPAQGTDPRSAACVSPVFRSAALCIGDTDRAHIRSYTYPGYYANANPNFRTRHEVPTPVMLELDGFQACTYKTSKYVDAKITDGVLPIYYKPNQCPDYDQTTCVANVRNGLPNTTAFLAQPAERRRAFLAYASRAARLLTLETGVPHYFPQLIRVDQNLSVVAQNTAQLANATAADMSQGSLVRYCPSTLGDPGLPFVSYEYVARECGDLGAVADALAAEGEALRVAAEGFVRHAYRTLFAREPDPAGAAFWVGTVTGAAAAAREAAALNVLDTFASSTTESIAAVGPDELTTRLHRAYLGRAPTAGELSSQRALARDAQIANLRSSYECRRHLRTLGLRTGPLNQGAFVAPLYTMLGRPQPAITGPEVSYWADQLYRGLRSPASIAQTFADSAELAATWATACAPPNGGVCNGWFVTEAYRALLHREPDPAGYVSWKGALDGGSVTRSGFVAAVLASQEFAARLARLGL